MPELLIELFSEEIPARMQQKAADDLRQMVTNALVEAGLTYEGAQAHGGKHNRPILCQLGFHQARWLI